MIRKLQFSNWHGYFLACFYQLITFNLEIETSKQLQLQDELNTTKIELNNLKNDFISLKSAYEKKLNDNDKLIKG